MPSSCDSDGNSSSLSTSLRHFRLARKTPVYAPPSPPFVDENCNEKNSLLVPDSTVAESKNGSLANAEVINTATTLSTSSGAATSTQQSYRYNPLSFRKYDAYKNSQFLVPCLIGKFQNALKKSSVTTVELTLRLGNEELKKLKELILQDFSVSEKWKRFVNQENLSTESPTERILKINRSYLNQLLQFLSKLYKDNFDSRSTSESTDSPVSVRTYSRKKDSSESSTASASSSCLPTLQKDISDKYEKPQRRGVMDEYEVFCSKELNLRKLLEAFPGADIMEAQDILVRCAWDLEKALVIAREQPLRGIGKKRLPSVNTNDSSDAKPDGEEIVLDSSDEEVVRPKKVNGRKTSTEKPAAAPPPKKPRRVVSSSDSEDESYKPSKYASVSISKSSNVPKSSPTRTRSSTEDSGNEKSFTSSVTIKPIPSISPVTIKPVPSEPEKPRVVPANALPNLPKGLVLLNLGDQPISSNSKKEEIPQNKVNNNKATITPTSEIAKNNVSRSSISPTFEVAKNNVSRSSISPTSELISNSSLTVTPTPQLTKTPIANDKPSTPASNKSAQVIRIKTTDSNAMPKDSSTPILPKSLSITPVSTGVSITPVVSSVVTPSSSTAPIQLDKPIVAVKSAPAAEKNSKAKRVKVTVLDDDDEEEYDEILFNSDDSDFEEDNLTAAHSAVLKFFQDATVEELICIPGCSKKKVESIMRVKPFQNWVDLVSKLSTDKYLNTDLLNGAKKVIDMRNAVRRIMAKCQQISFDMEDLVEDLKETRERSTDYVNKQPDLLNGRMRLTPYQMLGLNWLLLMHKQEVNGILADEMGLGKTAQAIAFLAYLKQVGRSGPHLIVVPSSVLDNWKQEIAAWWPDCSVLCYHGSQDRRRELRIEVLNDEVEEFDLMITTYNMVTSNAEDRGFFKRLDFEYVVFDEAHMLKNMASQRYQHLIKIRAPRRLLLTGTPLQNNLVELMSLLIFAMPNMFSGKTDHVKQMFSAVSKTEGNKSTFEKDRIEHAKRIMKPFVLRRLKKDVLQDLPAKQDETRMCALSEDQAKKYADLIETFSAEVRNNQEKDSHSSGTGMMMQLRRAANHPLLLRRFYDDEKLIEMSKAILVEPTHCEANPDLVFEDMSVMSDFELNKLCKSYSSLKPYVLKDENILNSGKFIVLDELLSVMKKEDHRVLLFSQFTMVLDIVEEYMKIRKHKFLRLDGQVPVTERQQLIDDFNSNPDIFVFLLSTRAGGLGINLTSADTVIIHDIDFNPYNDKQAEDRCHRVGQMKDVSVIRLISEGTIEEGILQRAKEKLKLERDIHEEHDDEEKDTASVAKLLRDALGITSKSASKS